MKKTYNKPEFEMLRIEPKEDILLTSGSVTVGDSNNDGWSDMWA